jgi:hypothetical protein
LTAPLKGVKEVDSHCHRLKPFFDVVPFLVVKLTVQILSKEGSQISTDINQKLGVRNIVLLGESMQERRGGIDPAAAIYVDFEQ